MKKIILFLLISPSILIGQSKQAVDTVNTDQLVLKGDLKYKIDTNEPFTGVWAGKWTNGKKYFEYHFVNGLQDGLTTVWYRSGKKSKEENYKNGKLDGIEISYNFDGNKNGETHYVNGRKSIYKSFSNGSITGIREYSPISSPETETRYISYNKNGLKNREIIYTRDGKTASETIWYEDESKKEEKIYVGDKLNHKIWDHNGNELIPEALIPKDTIDSKEIEWIDYHTAHKKDNNKPFTGVVTFEGELNYRNKRRGWYIPNSNYFSAVTFVFGEIDGPYTIWNNKNNQKIKEIASLNGVAANITFEGSYTSWHENEQMATKGSLKDGKKDGEYTTWFENGQMSSKGIFINGERRCNAQIWRCGLRT